MSFSYFDNNNKLTNLNFDSFKAGQKWNDVKTNNKQLDSIFSSKHVDLNQDGVIDQDELTLLQSLLKLADGLTTKPNDSDAADGVLQNEELAELKKQLQNPPEKTITVKEGETPEIPESYSFVDSYMANGKMYSISRPVDTSQIDPSKLEPGQYYLNNKFARYGRGYIAEPLRIQDATKGAVQNWAEGVNREIGTVRMADSPSEDFQKVLGEMREIGEEVGFDVQTVYSNTVWVEDTHIRRHDGSVYIPAAAEDFFNNPLVDNDFVDGVISRRARVGQNAQGAISKENSGVEYAKTVAESDKYYGESYLEGGNVLNTLRADGTPGAIIGDESIDYTLKQLGLSKSGTNVEIAKGLIAKDLNLKPENITYIPQFDFHIDMGYRHFGNGQVAIPDYQAGIEYLENNEISNMSAETKQDLIAKLKHMQEEAGPIIKESEDALKNGGYEVIKMPCFSTSKNGEATPINYMNGIAGTSNSKGSLPKGTTYYITNKSDYPEINQYMQDFLKTNAGIDKTYFVSTTEFLYKCGGIDCLTEEYNK